MHIGFLWSSNKTSKVHTYSFVGAREMLERCREDGGGLVRLQCSDQVVEEAVELLKGSK